MTLRKKTLLIIGMTGLTLIIIFYFAAYLIVMKGFTTLEKQAMHKHVERTVGAISKEIDRIASIASEAKQSRRDCFVISSLHQESSG